MQFAPAFCELIMQFFRAKVQMTPLPPPKKKEHTMMKRLTLLSFMFFSLGAYAEGLNIKPGR